MSEGALWSRIYQKKKKKGGGELEIVYVVHRWGDTGGGREGGGVTIFKWELTHFLKQLCNVPLSAHTGTEKQVMPRNT